MKHPANSERKLPLRRNDPRIYARPLGDSFVLRAVDGPLFPPRPHAACLAIACLLYPSRDPTGGRRPACGACASRCLRRIQLDVQRVWHQTIVVALLRPPAGNDRRRRRCNAIGSNPHNETGTSTNKTSATRSRGGTGRGAAATCLPCLPNTARGCRSAPAT
jgi:hypothetical protein